MIEATCAKSTSSYADLECQSVRSGVFPHLYGGNIYSLKISLKDHR